MIEKYYLEIIEELSNKDMFEYLPQILRLKVKNKLIAKNLFLKYKSLFSKIKYKARFHIHRHSKSGNEECEIQEL